MVKFPHHRFNNSNGDSIYLGGGKAKTIILPRVASVDNYVMQPQYMFCDILS